MNALLHYFVPLSRSIARRPSTSNYLGCLTILVTLTLVAQATYSQTLTGSVGERGTNQNQDVRWVQSVLNQVPESCGGPSRPLTEDGIIGPQTVAAIKRFQRIQIGFDDGLIEPDRRTHQRLLEFVDFPNQDRSGPLIAWGAQVKGPFKAKLKIICDELEIEANHLMAAMAFETAETFSPAIKNAAGSGATGLIQFMPKTAEGLGTTTDALAAMSAVEQLDYVKKYFEPYKGKCKSLSDVYMAILWPAAVGKPEDHVLFDRATRPTTYEQNRGLDSDGDGQITKSEAAAKIQAKLEKGIQPGFRG